MVSDAGPGALPPARRHRRGPALALALLLAGSSVLAACSSDDEPSTATTAPDGTESPAGQPELTVLAPDATAMDEVVAEVAESFHEAGMAVLIRTPEGDYTNLHGSDALQGGQPPTLDTRVRIGSNTKTWTGTAILQMVEEGKLSVDDPVSEYRPDVPNGDQITIGQLLDMRSGLYNYTETLELNTALDTEPERVWTPEELLAMGLEQPPYFPPGEGWHYSNTNTVLLGLIAEQVDGKPLAQVFQDRFFTPLGMTGSTFPANDDPAIPAPASRGYFFGTNVGTMEDPGLSEAEQAAIDAGEVLPRDVTNDNPSWTWSAGQGISTANDLATWVEAMVGGELLDDETQALRMASILPTDPDDPQSASYGYGMAQMGPLFGHTGELPGFNSFMGHDPVNDVTIVVWGNVAPGADGEAPAVTLAIELLPFVYEGFTGPAPEVVDPDPETEQ